MNQFESLNPYDRAAVRGSILNFVDANYQDSDSGNPRRQLLGYSIAAKRYALYERTGSKINIVDPKAHGLGYLYPPSDSPKKWEEEHDAPKWIYQFWECLLRITLKMEGNNPRWIKRPQMMRMTVTTFNVLKRLHAWEGFRPYNFFLLEDQLYRYPQHPEAKSLGSDGKPSNSTTRGLLQRAHIIAGKHRRIGKESDRRWEEGADLESLSYVPVEFEPPGSEHKRDELVRASENLIRKIKKIGIRELIDFGLGRRILEKSCRRELVNAETLREYEQRISRYIKTGD